MITGCHFNLKKIQKGTAVKSLSLLKGYVMNSQVEQGKSLCESSICCTIYVEIKESTKICPIL
jgi:hypothetical protein